MVVTRKGRLAHRGWILTSVMSVVSCLMLIFSPLAASATPWGKKFGAPYKGTVLIGNTSSLLGSASGTVTNGSFFDLNSGRAGFSAFVSADSSGLTPQASGYDTSLGWLATSIYVHVQIPFNNRSGTRSLDSVEVKFGYSIYGNITLVNGTCPWVKSIHNYNECVRWVSAAVGLQPLMMTNLHDSKNGPHVYGTCQPANCSIGAASSYNLSKNSSLGLSTSTMRTNGSASFSRVGNISIRYTPLTAITRSETLVASFEITCGVYAELTSKHGRGGLRGASDSAYLNFDTNGNGITIRSIVES